MNKQQINEWNNPLADIASSYCLNGAFTEHGGKFEVILSKEELMLVVGYMMMGMNKVKKINEVKKDEK